MKPLLIYFLRTFIRSPYSFAPIVTYLFIMAIQYSYRPNPIADSYSVTATLLFFASAWIGRGFYHAEHPDQRALTIMHSRKKWIYFIGMWIACSIIIAAMTCISILFPIAAWMFERLPTTSELFTAIVGHYMLGVLGISISLFTQRSWIKVQSNALAILFIWLMAGMMHTQMERWLPDGLNFLAYLLPPALPFIKAMLNPDDIVSMSASTIHVIVYVLILLSCYVYVSVKRKDVML
ncbi:hypothetical protein ACFQ3J_09865 [Paenibacillus provencensis]|uniref:ABC-2 type transport system permease protein n=1 Tax=Paenibacillus provencensis TaxID=441151 RepID=A0ABW3PQG2_9BACL|nr:hypothetical protein [Paenibacillus sp. MER 78]